MILTDTVYRAHHPRWSFSPLSGEGARLHGGRFNPKGVDALYTSLRLEAAWLEAQQAFPFKAAQPMLIVAYETSISDIVDLTEDAERRRFGIALGDLTCAWEDLASRGIDPPSWAIARRLMAAGVAGIIAPSFAAGAGPLDRNAIFWRWNDIATRTVKPIDDHGRLPKDDSSWR